MDILNVEIKARCKNRDRIRKLLKNKEAGFKGVDHQIDTYFNVVTGRLKLREGSIENNLIFYQRSDVAEPKTSDIKLFPVEQSKELKALLATALGIKVTIDKQREIYFIDNVKFHLDNVEGLGSFIEIEAIEKDGNIGEAALREQCEHYLELFSISKQDLIKNSYSDMLLDKQSFPPDR